MKIKKGDKVVVICGKDKGKVGVVKQLFPKNQRVIVEGINMLTKHKKPTQQDPEGGIEKKEGPISVSNVMHVLSQKDKNIQTTRIAYKIEKNKNGKKTKKRIAKKTGVEL